MDAPPPLPSPGHLWFLAETVQALLQPFPKLQALSAAEVANLADSLNVGTTRLLIQLQLDDDERLPRPGLLGLATSAHALVVRLHTRASPARQLAAFRWAMETLPAAALVGLFDAAAGAGALRDGEDTVRAAVDCILAADSPPAKAMEAARSLAGWAEAAAAARPPRRSARDSQMAPARAFALLVLEAVHHLSGDLPRLTRRTDTQEDAGAAAGRDLALLEGCFKVVQAGCMANTNLSPLAGLTALSPGRETLAEWILTARGNPRRLRGWRRQFRDRFQTIAFPIIVPR